MINTDTTERESLQKIINFVCNIGLTAIPDESAGNFLPDLHLDAGALRYRSTVHPADVLHEIAHVAIVPNKWRYLMSNNIAKAQRIMCEATMSSGLHPDDIEYRAVMQTSDPEATAWAWAAGVHLGLPRTHIIKHDDPRSYDGEGGDIATCLAIGLYIGIHGLQHAGFCRAGLFGNQDLPRYPKLQFWLQK